VLTQYLPFELVDDVLEQTRTVQRRLRILPSRAGVYFVLALGLFPHLGYVRVWGKLTAGWPAWTCRHHRTNISDRAVRLVITRLEADGHLIVHRGGGRAGSTNPWTVVIGDRFIHSPGQTVSSGRLSPLTDCQGRHWRPPTPDSAVSRDPGHSCVSRSTREPAGNRRRIGVLCAGEFFTALGSHVP
jgi:hypothetical protein